MQQCECSQQYCSVHLKFARRVYLSVVSTHTKYGSYSGDRYVSLVVEIISQCLHISKHKVVCLKHTQLLFVNNTSAKLYSTR